MFGLVGSPENHLYDISRGEIEHVDENQAEGDKEDNPGRDNVLNIVITAHDTHANNDGVSTGGTKKDTQLIMTNMAEGR